MERLSLNRVSRLASVAFVLALVASHCGQSQPEPDSSSAGAGGELAAAGASAHNAGASATGGASGKGGAAGKGGQAGKPAQGGSSGKSGGSGQGGSGGQTQPLSFQPAGKILDCEFHRLIPPEATKLLSWKPCDWASDCEEVVFDTQPLPWEPEWLGRPFFINDLGDGTFASFMFAYSNKIYYFVFHEDGSFLDAWGLEEPCASIGFSLRGDRFGWQVSLSSEGVKSRYGGVMGTVGSPSPLVSFESIPVPSFPPVLRLFSDDRWAWSWGSGYISSISTSNPTDQVLFANADPNNGPVYSNDHPTTDGKNFLFSVAVAHPKLGYTKKIAISDGVKPPTDYLVPPEEIDVGSAEISGPFLSWRQGYGRKELNLYEKVELWSSLYDPDPSKLKPHKVTELSKTPYLEDLLFKGGWGYVVQFSELQLLELVHLPTDKVFTLKIPQDEKGGHIAGVTKTHVWFSTVIPGGTTYKAARYVRYKLPILP